MPPHPTPHRGATAQPSVCVATPPSERPTGLPRTAQPPAQSHRDVGPSHTSPSIVRLLPRSESGDGEGSATQTYFDVQRANVEYSAISASPSRAPTQGSFALLSSATSPASGSGDGISSLSTSAVRRLPGVTPSLSVFSDLASEDAKTTQHAEEAGVGAEDAYSTVALLRRFLEARSSIAVGGNRGKSPEAVARHAPRVGGIAAAASAASTSHTSQVFDALRSAHLVPSVVPSVAGAEVNAEAAATAAGSPHREPQGPYRVESTYMRSSTLAAVVKRQKGDRHAAYASAHSFFQTQMPGVMAAAATASRASPPPARLPAALDMPLHLRCPMCQKHDSMCNRCHRRWSTLQDAYREEAALRCYSTLDVSRRGALALLTAALGTGSFLEMKSTADGLALTQTRVWVAAASLEALLKHGGHVLSSAVEERLSHAEDTTRASRGTWLKVAHVACLFGQRDVLRSLWLRCRGGCSYAAQITPNGLHALELLAEPYEPALQSMLHKCGALREYLLWARVMQCLAVKSTDDSEAAQLAGELCKTGSWVGLWSAALVAYVKGERERCVELCDELLRGAAAPTAAAVAAAAPANASVASPSTNLFRGTSVVSFSSSIAEATTPPPPSPFAPLTQQQQQQQLLAPLTADGPNGAGTPLSMRPAMDVGRVEALKELALRPVQPFLPRLEATEEKEEDARSVQPDGVVLSQATRKAANVCRLRVRRLPFPLMRRIVSFCDAPTLLLLHESTPMPLLQWVALARIKCLPPAQWTRMLATNPGYAALMQALCLYESPPTPSREETEASAQLAAVASPRNDAETRVGAAAALACPPFQPIRVSVVDIHDLRDLTVKAVTLVHRAGGSAEDAAAAAVPRAVGEWLLQSLFGRATSLVNQSKYLVLSKVYRLTAPDADSNVANTDVSEWRRACVRPWEVDVNATIRWCTYVQQHAEAEKLV